MTSHWQYLWVIGLVQDHNIHIPAFKHVPVTNKHLASHWQYIYIYIYMSHHRVGSRQKYPYTSIHTCTVPVN
jgi:hypothetical protein